MTEVTATGRADERPASRILTSLRLQAVEFGQRRLLLAIVLAMPVVFFALIYYTTPNTAAQFPVFVPESGGTRTVYLPARETWPLSVQIMGVVWAVGTVAFFSAVGNLERDRRLVVSGYASWQIMVARLGILAGITLPLALVAMVPSTVITSSRHPEIVFAANLLAGFIAAGFGLLVGTLLPRPTEGMLLVLLVTGIGMSLDQEALKYFFLYSPIQLLVIGRLALNPAPLGYVLQSIGITVAFLVPSVLIWWRRTRVHRSASA